MKNTRTKLLFTLLALCITTGIATYLSIPLLLEKASTHLLRNQHDTQLSFTSSLRGIQQLDIESFTFEQKSPQYIFRAHSPLITLRIDWSALLNGQVFSLHSKSLYIEVLAQPGSAQRESEHKTTADLDLLSTQLPRIHSLLSGVLQIDSLRVELPSEMNIPPLDFSTTRLKRSKNQLAVTTLLKEVVHTTTSSTSLNPFPRARIHIKIMDGGAFVAEAHSVSEASAFALRLERNNTSEEERFTFTADSAIQTAVALLKRFGLHTATPTTELNSTARMQAEILFSLQDSMLRIAEQSSLQLLNFTFQQVRGKHVRFTVEESLTVSKPFEVQGKAHLDISKLQITESLTALPASLEIALRPSSKDKSTDAQIIAIKISQLSMLHQDVEFLPLSIKGVVLLDSSALAASFEATQESGIEKVLLEAKHDFLKSSGSLSLTGSLITIAPVLKQLSHFIPSALSQQKIQAGSADVHYRRRWGALASQLLTLQLAGVDMRGPGYELSNAALSLELTNFSPLRLARPVKLTADKLNFGIPLSELTAKVALVHDNSDTIQAIAIPQAQGTLLDGTVALRKGYYSLQKNSGSFPLAFKSISIAELLALYPESGISGQGRLHGELPLEIRSGNVFMQNGNISSVAPGKLKAQLENPALRQRYENALGTLIQALENYYFSSLKAQGSLAPSGDLDLSVEVEGSNPQFQDGRKINLNISISENLPALLRSLQLSSELVGIGKNPKNLQSWSTPTD